MMPKVYLSIDNCFASKRWTRPEDWMAVVRDLGLRYVEASADTECDPLYTTPDYLADWADRVRVASDHTGVAVRQFYSGHGTYSTLGLAHTDARVRRHILEDWLFPMCDLAGSLGAGLGFFCHAFDISVLRDPAAYRAAYDTLVASLAAVAERARDSGCPTAAVEQMYSPHQVPWTLAGAETLLRAVTAQAAHPFYVTVDVGHQTGQARYVNEDPAYPRDIYPYYYAKPEDGDTGQWLRRLGRYSPIIHLQQTDGRSSKHLPFTDANNAAGVVRGEAVLADLLDAFQRPDDAGMPPPVDAVYLTLEIFAGTADRPSDILPGLHESVAYWRRFVPEDGLALDTLARRGRDV